MTAAASLPAASLPAASLLAASLLAASGASVAGAVENDLWGFAPTAQGGQAQSCALAESDAGPDSPRVCVVLYCDHDGAFWIAQRFDVAPAALEGADGALPGALIFGDTVQEIGWASGPGPAHAETLWRAPIFDFDAFRTDFAAAGGLGLRVGADDLALIQRYTVAASDIALALLDLRCRPKRSG